MEDMYVDAPSPHEGAVSPFEDGSPISIRSQGSPMNIRTAFEEVTGVAYIDENGMDYRLRDEKGVLGTNVFLVDDSIYKFADRDLRESIQNEIAVYDKISTLPPEEQKYFLTMKSKKEKGSIVYIELEYIEGLDLVSYVKSHSMSSARYIARSIAYILRILSHIGVVHGDLHLGNIMIPEEELMKERPLIKVIDFGNSSDYLYRYSPYYNLDQHSANNYTNLLRELRISAEDIHAIEAIIATNTDPVVAYDEIIRFWDGQVGGEKNLPIEYKMPVNKTRKMPAVGTKRCVFNGTAKHTSGGLEKKDLMLHKGRIISRKKHALGKKAFKHLVKSGYKPKKGTFKLFKKHTRGTKSK